uniref:Uncharacterized LOC103184170 n=1 Tax=Callorhinchus milii TaxID=7868 RepID=A0A4W3JR71_CALMI
MLGALAFSFLVVLLPCVCPQGSTNRTYFLDKDGSFKMIGLEVQGNGPVAWRWKPHSEENTEKTLVTFTRRDQWWEANWGQTYYSDFYSTDKRDYMIKNESDSPSLIFSSLKYKLAGLFLLTQPENNHTLYQHEVFGVKVEKERYPVYSDNDVTLSCSISRLPHGVSLQWKHRESTQHNSGNSTEQLLINNTLYLIVRHVREDDKQKYMCEVQDNGSTVLTGNMDFEVYTYEYVTQRLYRSSTNRSELHLICKYNYPGNEVKFSWRWKSVHSQYPETQIASGRKGQSININRTHFGERLKPATTLFNGKDFTMHIVPVMFEDAGTYTCFVGTILYVTVELITVKGMSQTLTVVSMVVPWFRI